MAIPGDFAGDSRSDVFLYDPHQQEGQFRTPDGTGGWTLVGSTLPALRDSWSIIVAGDFSPASFDELFFYDPLAAVGEFWSTDGLGHLNQIGTTWTGLSPRKRIIVAGDFGPSSRSDLLFYDPTVGEIHFYSSETRTQLGPPVIVPKSYTMIIVGDFGGSSTYVDLFCYDPANGEAQFFMTDGLGGLDPIGPTLLGLRSTWNTILAGQFQSPCGAASTRDDLYFCDAAAGQTEFWGTDGAGGIFNLGTMGTTNPNWGLTAKGRFGAGPETQLLQYEPGWSLGVASTVYIVAHQDDDFLFMNPDIQNTVLSRERLRIIYLTSGQNDLGPAYWRDGRERGILSGYATLAGTPGSSWTRIQTGTPSLYRLAAYPGLEVEFIRLPNGTEYGGTYPPTYPHSLASLWQGDVANLATVNSATTFTISSLAGHLVAVMNDVQATRVCTLDPQGWNGVTGSPCESRSVEYNLPGLQTYAFDHIDHCTAARIASLASQQYSAPHTTTGFRGYTIALLSENLTPTEIRRKRVAFDAYASCDANVSVPGFGGLYDFWISRQYARPNLLTDVVISPLPTTMLLSLAPNPAGRTLNSIAG